MEIKKDKWYVDQYGVVFKILETNDNIVESYIGYVFCERYIDNGIYVVTTNNIKRYAQPNEYMPFLPIDHPDRSMWNLAYGSTMHGDCASLSVIKSKWGYIVGYDSSSSLEIKSEIGVKISDNQTGLIDIPKCEKINEATGRYGDDAYYTTTFVDKKLKYIKNEPIILKRQRHGKRRIIC